MPDVASLPRKATEMGRLYQPPKSGGRPGTAPVTRGAVLSRRIVTGADAEVVPQKTVHVRVIPVEGVSTVNVFVSQPCVSVSPPGDHDHLRVTSLRYQ